MSSRVEFADHELQIDYDVNVMRVCTTAWIKLGIGLGLHVQV